MLLRLRQETSKAKLSFPKAISGAAFPPQPTLSQRTVCFSLFPTAEHALKEQPRILKVGKGPFPTSNCKLVFYLLLLLLQILIHGPMCFFHNKYLSHSLNKYFPSNPEYTEIQSDPAGLIPSQRPSVQSTQSQLDFKSQDSILCKSKPYPNKCDCHPDTQRERAGHEQSAWVVAKL